MNTNFLKINNINRSLQITSKFKIAKHLKIMKKSLSYLCLTLLLIGCAPTVQYVKYAGNQIGNGAYAKIYVIWPTSYSSAVKMSIYQDEKLIGKLGAKSFLSWEVDPSKGEISIISKSGNR